jgi:hypothetical protein
MKLPRPSDKLAGCVWLPRIIAKARLLLRHELPEDYVVRFAHPTGVDGHFLAHFGLSRDDVLAIAPRTDAEVAEWFLQRTGDVGGMIATWNEIALNLGRPGYPLAERFPIALATTYRHIDSRGMTTVFEVLEADEKTG